MSVENFSRRVHFSTAVCIDGYEVVDQDGRPYAKRRTQQSANGVAYFFNEAARNGPKALAGAFSAVSKRDFEA